jgi:hypothetical protein
MNLDPYRFRHQRPLLITTGFMELMCVTYN